MLCYVYKIISLQVRELCYYISAIYVQNKTFKNKDGSTRTYLYIVEGKRVNGKVRQRIVANLGRLEKLQEGQLDKLIEGLARFSRKQWIEACARSVEAKWAKDFGPALIFRRLWEDLKLDKILRELLSGTDISIDVEEAVFAMVLNRLCDPASKFGVSRWKEKVYRPEFEKLELHHFYRALDFLADHKEEIEGSSRGSCAGDIGFTYDAGGDTDRARGISRGYS